MKAIEVINVIEFDTEHFYTKETSILYGCFSIYDRIQLVLYKMYEKIQIENMFHISVCVLLGVSLENIWKELYWEKHPHPQYKTLII